MDSPSERTPAGESQTISVNLLCILGAVVGLASLLLPWQWTAEGFSSTDWSVADLLRDGAHGHPGIIYPALIVYVTGTIMALFAPPGGFVQIVGLTMFCSEEIKREENYTFMETGLSVGFFVATISTAIVMAALISPTGPGHGAGTKWWSSRAFTFARTRVANNRVLRLSWATPCDIFTVMRLPSRKVTVGLVAASVVALIAFSTTLLHGDDGPVSKVGEGVLLSFGELRGGGNWDNSMIRVSDGVIQVQWNLTSDVWEERTWTAVSFEPMDLGGIDLRLTVVDWGGDGYRTLGDQVVLAPINGTAFENDVPYAISISCPREITATDIPSVMTVVTFVLQSDGSVDSTGETTISGGWLTYHEDLPWIPSIVAVSIAVTLSLTFHYVLIRAVVRHERRAHYLDDPY